MCWNDGRARRNFSQSAGRLSHLEWIEFRNGGIHFPIRRADVSSSDFAISATDEIFDYSQLPFSAWSLIMDEATSFSFPTSTDISIGYTMDVSSYPVGYPSWTSYGCLQDILMSSPMDVKLGNPWTSKNGRLSVGKNLKFNFIGDRTRAMLCIHAAIVLGRDHESIVAPIIRGLFGLWRLVC
jgi:hypothetical protein